jgi:Putative polyhydroxyalkanoic acid system protein (PHA_gran_rgn)
MARLTIVAEHNLPREEALRRLKTKLGGNVAARYRRQVMELHEGWTDGTFAFRFKAVGVRVSGTLTVDEAAVRVAADVPLAALLFKKKIDEQVRAELVSALD